ncbi:unnamed protein product [Tilletia laevis]|uniref:Maltose/galactoside acetyltransferase domain-containing protein n=2 Tax=Tilletia TaxID=13289 RepID=A0A8X7SVY5_9BASI|nr:hypothetical protein CF336_g3606 [Tilletia laevis]KAE8199245.1 hypothetical protein CF328_g3303 [Tilletia controversa]KAE8261838.1 hypothetical protein A4X03_0g2928 [Tilletia caries]KAE8203939.1 hypothetical protein CF335_g2835 [Tilletia laevis]KAE8245904.1 hypothetical protein A4X06_0g5337 [Tilletia controversa]
MSKTTDRYSELDRKFADRFDQLSQTEKALLGLPYIANDPPLITARLRARRLLYRFNHSQVSPTDPPALQPGERAQGVGASADDTSSANRGVEFDAMGPERRAILADLLGVEVSTLARVEIEPPFFCDYGTNIHLGDSFAANTNVTILDCADVHIGTGTVFGPFVQLYGGTHSTAIAEREHGLERALPIKVGSNCWLGGCTVVNAGVSIGNNCTIGCNSVVTRDIPDNSIAVGSPARVIRTLEAWELPRGAEGWEVAAKGLGREAQAASSKE